MDAIANNPNLLSDLAYRLRQTFRLKALETLKLTLAKQAIGFGDVANHDDFLYGQRMGCILIHGRAIKVTFKIHYEDKLARMLASQKLGMPLLSLDQDAVNDFMREYCNLAAGYIADWLARHQILVDISIPLISDGFDEVWFSDRVRPSEIKDCWQLSWDDGSIICSCAASVRDADQLMALEPPAANAEPDDDRSLEKGMTFL